MTAQTDIETLVREHYDYIRRLALSILDNGSAAAADVQAEADEAAQDTFIAAHRALPKFRGEASPRTWLTRIAVNQAIGRLRKRKSRRRMQAALENRRRSNMPSPGLEQSTLQAETRRRIWAGVDSLGEKHRIPVLLRYLHELSISEIADSLNLPEGTVHSRLHHARRKLQAILEKETRHD